jgi:hypothetical protein
MQGFKSAKSARRFVSVHAAVYNTFNVQRHLIGRPTHRQFRTAAHQSWNDATLLQHKSGTFRLMFRAARSLTDDVDGARTGIWLE